MGTTLTGLTPATTYDALIKTGDNAPIDATLKKLSDGLGNDLPMEVSTTTINFTNQLQQSGVAVPTASEVAAKQDTLVSGTNIKTINSTSLLGSGNISVAPASGINATAIGTGVVDNTEFGYLNGVTSSIQTQLDAKQDTLVSGTNIKTINSTSLLGSGNITIAANPSGVAGAIQFSDGSAFSSDATKFFWDNTNKRLGIGTNAPNTALDISASLTSIFTLRNGATNFITTRTSGIGGLDTGFRIWDNSNNFTLDLYGSGSYDHPQRHRFYIGGAGTGERFLIGSTTAATIKGSGSTSATTSLLVQNSSGVDRLKVTDNGLSTFTAETAYTVAITTANNGIIRASGGFQNADGAYYSDGNWFARAGSGGGLYLTANNGGPSAFGFYGNNTATGFNIGAGSSTTPSAAFQINSTTQGFLPPRMTTTQKNAISTPAAGLVVYDSTTNKLCCYNGSTWNDLF